MYLDAISVHPSALFDRSRKLGVRINVSIFELRNISITFLGHIALSSDIAPLLLGTTKSLVLISNCDSLLAWLTSVGVSTLNVRKSLL